MRRLLAVLAVITVAGCSASGPAPRTTTSTPAPVTSTSSTLSSTPATSPTNTPRTSTTPAPSTSTRSTPPPTSSTPTAQSRRQLPRGGTKILGRYRVVAFYGAAGAPVLGVLGSTTPEAAATAIAQRAAAFAPWSPHLQPAMELIATVAQGSAGPDGTFSKPVAMSTLQRYLDVAHANKMLLILDLQPGRAEFIDQARALEPLLLDPSVGLGLDPEWKVGPKQKPGGGRIGSSSAAAINEVIDYVSGLVQRNRLPNKLIVVHQFTQRMLPDRGNIAPKPGTEVTFHADGFGSPRVKINVFGSLRFPGRPFGVGFKLFLKQDSRLMTPAAVMALDPRPDVITFQ